MRTSPPEDLRRVFALLLLGALVFAGGLWLARRHLPEWRSSRLPPAGAFVARYQTLARTLGFQPEGRMLRATLVTRLMGVGLVCAPRLPGDPISESSGACAEVRQEGTLPGSSARRELSIFFSSKGKPRAVAWIRPQALLDSFTNNSGASAAQLQALATVLAGPGETMGKLLRTPATGPQGGFLDLVGSSPPEHLVITVFPAEHIVVRRAHGTAAEGAAELRTPWERVVQTILHVVFVLAVFIAFFVLIGKRHIDLINAGILAAVFFVTVIPELFAHEPNATSLIATVLWILGKSAWVFLAWAVGESLLRSYRPNFTTSLDSLRAGRIGPRGGRALLCGLGLGTGLAGLRLALLSLGTLSPATWPRQASLSLPLSSIWENWIGQSFVTASAVMLAMAVALRILPARWAPLGAAFAVALCWPVPLWLTDFWIELVARVVLALILVVTLRTFGLTALLTATVTLLLLPTAVFSALNLSWLPMAFAGAAGTTLAVLVLGLVGLRRPESIEAQRLQPPAYIRRIEEERRLRYEMDLLSRMQEGLLPEVPEVPGWQIAARSILATEAGGDLYDFLFDEDGNLWVAVGDVAGHGYSCAIVQAMTTAALTSVIRAGMMPSEVLLHVDRVIRRGGSARNFASLTLLRLDPASGEVVLSNAGHPFPLHILDGDVSEIVLPGLPLGKGPQRRYPDFSLHLPPGSALVLCSDGLMETQDWRQTSYGFDRPLEVLRGATGASAEEILEHLLADWRRHLGTEEQPDDTTIVVVKRAEG